MIAKGGAYVPAILAGMYVLLSIGRDWMTIVPYGPEGAHLE